MITLASSPVAALTSILTTDTAWQLDGLCNQTNPDAFFPERGSTPAAAKAVCMGCPVRTVCLEYALDRNERYGVWGGMDADERRNLRRRRIAQASKLSPIPAPAPVAVPAVAKVHPSYRGGTPPAQCGTESAYRRHKRNGEQIDDACAIAHRAWLDKTSERRRETRKRSKARIRARKGPRVLAPCGTPAAYQRHKRRGEQACDACRLAQNEDRRKYPRKQQAAA
ncbi:WhiB family transcriptional regulator [Streptomyces sp. MSC1_001]|uniref:WhiB family transcriptional regulator n=1 Tax=Streptomyces sp. MSC1_001 TaxID=2909263 RepID=UPI0027E44434|nr:WhiB family transcriptional regulator [Streptomyces sp. MSC1_001]